MDDSRRTKEIEAAISNEVWDRQRQWEMKKDALSDLLRAIADFEQALVETPNIAPADLNSHQATSPHSVKVNAIVAAWKTASNAFERASLVASLVSTKETQDAIIALNRSLRDASTNLLGGGERTHTPSMRSR